MGSFNTSCMLTNQTIAPEDTCRVVLLKQATSIRKVDLKHERKVFMPAPGAAAEETIDYSRENYRETDCYPDCFWQPKSLFIKCTYDDYGRVVPDLSDISSRYGVFDVIEYIMSESMRAEATERSAEFNLKKFYLESVKPALPEGSSKEDQDTQLMRSWNYIWDAHENGRLFGKANGFNGALPLTFGIIHEEAYLELEASIRLSLGESLLSEDEIVRDALAQAIEYESLYSNPREISEEKTSFALLAPIMSKLAEISSQDAVPKMSIRSYLKTILLKEVDFLSLKHHLTAVIKMHLVIKGMHFYNLKFSPQVYTPQDYSNNIGEGYAKFVSKVSNKVTKVRREEDESENCFTTFGKFISDEQKNQIVNLFLKDDPMFKLEIVNYNPHSESEFCFEYKISTNVSASEVYLGLQESHSKFFGAEIFS